jgi:osmoprotectant transport system permease protein
MGSSHMIDATLRWFADPLTWTGPTGIPNRLTEHVLISAASLVIALAIAFPLGLWIGHTGRFASAVVNSANFWRALPSLAVIAIVLPITAALDPQAGFKIYPTVAAMIVLGIPPILVNTFSGIRAVERDLVDAGRGQGMTEPQLLSRVELPLAVSVIVTGIRSSAVQIVATATLGAIFGFGALGRYLVDGVSRFDTGQIIGGAILVAALVIVTDVLFALVQRALTPAGVRGDGRTDLETQT